MLLEELKLHALYMPVSIIKDDITVTSNAVQAVVTYDSSASLPLIFSPSLWLAMSVTPRIQIFYPGSP